MVKTKTKQTAKKKPKPKPPEVLAEWRVNRERRREQRTNFQNDDQVLTPDQWYALNNLTERTGRRILESGNGPDIVMLSAHRKGITVKANREWQESRVMK